MAIKSIEEYIQQVSNMENTSVGGSPSYHFGEVVLVKYGPMDNQYGQSREGAEETAQLANEKNAEGVRTPKHLAVKRISSTEVDYKGNEYQGNTCWVLQETAKGRSFHDYCHNQDKGVHLDMQSRIANAPAKHFEQYANDLKELFNAGYELKPKNLFYDESEQGGGFTIIDLLGAVGAWKGKFDGSTKDVLSLHQDMQSIANCSTLSNYDDKATEEQKAQSKQLYLKTKQKIFSALEKTIPDFEKHRRHVLRSIDTDALEYFAKNGTEVGDLTLTPQELEQFDKTVETLISDCTRQVVEGYSPYPGMTPYGNISSNVIRNDSGSLGLQNSWKYHPQNTLQESDFENDWEFDSARDKQLQAILQGNFETQLEMTAQNNSNPNIVKAMGELEAEQQRRDEWAKLQGFKGYGFLNNDEDAFSFPNNVSKTQQYKQLGNSVSIPVIEELAEKIMISLKKLEENLN